MIRLNAVEIGEIVVYQVRGRNIGEIRSRISLRYRTMNFIKYLSSSIMIQTNGDPRMLVQ